MVQETLGLELLGVFEGTVAFTTTNIVTAGSAAPFFVPSLSLLVES